MKMRETRLCTTADAPVFTTGGKPSTWFPPGRLVKQKASKISTSIFLSSPLENLIWITTLIENNRKQIFITIYMF